MAEQSPTGSLEIDIRRGPARPAHHDPSWSPDGRAAVSGETLEQIHDIVDAGHLIEFDLHRGRGGCKRGFIEKPPDTSSDLRRIQGFGRNHWAEWRLSGIGGAEAKSNLDGPLCVPRLIGAQWQQIHRKGVLQCRDHAVEATMGDDGRATTEEEALRDVSLGTDVLGKISKLTWIAVAASGDDEGHWFVRQRLDDGLQDV